MQLLEPWEARSHAAGLDASVLPWLQTAGYRDPGRRITTGCSSRLAGSSRGLPVHNFALVYLGVHLFDNVALDALAVAAAERNRWEFLLTVAPLRMVGGTGSPINPIATF